MKQIWMDINAFKMIGRLNFFANETNKYCYIQMVIIKRENDTYKIPIS